MGTNSQQLPALPLGVERGEKVLKEALTPQAATRGHTIGCKNLFNPGGVQLELGEGRVSQRMRKPTQQGHYSHVCLRGVGGRVSKGEQLHLSLP